MKALIYGVFEKEDLREEISLRTGNFTSELLPLL